MKPARRLTRGEHRLVVMAGLLLLLAVITGFVLVITGSFDQGGPTAPDSGASVEVRIPPGISAHDVARILARAGVIKSVDAFLGEVEKEAAAGDLKPGAYSFRVGEDSPAIIAELRRGTGPDGLRVTIPEGLSIDQTATRLDQTYDLDGAEYARLAEHPKGFVLPLVGGATVHPSTLEGLLFPATYAVAQESDTSGLIQQQLNSFERETSHLPWQNAADLGLSPYEIVIVASLIEKEARLPEDRARVAAVIYNRLAKDMSLGIDATVRYALKKWTGPLTKSDLEIGSPYNTRRNKGLPPGPVASPGLASLEAALAPEHVPYLYYVLIDAEGHHFFTDSYDEFLKAKAGAPK
jgi:UPF0755 protein